MQHAAELPGNDGVADVVRRADLSPRGTAATPGSLDGGRRTAPPLIIPGGDPGTSPPVPRGPEAFSRSASAVASEAVPVEAIEINFDNADIGTVAKSLLGDTLGLNYVVDPRVQGAVTLVSARPVARKDVLPMLETVLRMSNAAVVREGSLVRIVPAPEAIGSNSLASGTEPGGFGVSIVPLRYTSAATVAKTIENFLSRPGAVRVDQTRNILLIQGTAPERGAALDVIAAFDVEWLRNQSVGIFPLKAAAPETMIRELEKLFDTGEGGQGQGIVKLQPISRMNAVMAVAHDRKLLERVTQWVARLDRADTTGTTVRIYRLKYGSAPKVAKVLTDIFIGKSSGTGDTASSQLAPGTNAAASRLEALGAPSGPTASALTSPGTTGSQSGQSVGTDSSTTGSGTHGTLAAAFDTFAGKDADKSGTGTTASGSVPRGVFQNVRITADSADNSIVIYSNQEDYAVIERALQSLDRPPLQVAIDAMVAEVELTDQLQYGVQYYLTSNAVGMAPDRGSVGLFNAAQSTAQTALLSRVTPGFNMLLGSESNPKLVINALSTLTTVKVLSAPSLVVADNQPAILQVGQQIPISTGSATVLSSQNTVVNTIQMQSVGIILKVLPHVHANGSIELELDQEISNVVNQTTTPNLTPTISQRRIHSTVEVNSGQTVLLGGLISQNNQRQTSGVPGLAQIQYLGDLLGNKTETKDREEIIVFVKSQLIRNGFDAARVAEEFRERLDNMRGVSSVISGNGTGPAAGVHK